MGVTIDCDLILAITLEKAGATMGAVTEKVRVWGEYVSVVYQILAKRNTKMSEAWAKESKISYADWRTQIYQYSKKQNSMA